MASLNVTQMQIVSTYWVPMNVNVMLGILVMALNVKMSTNAMSTTANVIPWPNVSIHWAGTSANVKRDSTATGSTAATMSTNVT